MTNMEKKQELYIELKELDQNIKEVQEHIDKLDQQIAQILSVKESLTEFSELKKGVDMRVPLADGIFISAELKEVENVYVNVGANVSVKKPIKDVEEMIDKQEKELKSYRANIMVNFQQMISRVEEIQEEFK